jgi:glycosyltransferase involved in cell wall biosynthesis
MTIAMKKVLFVSNCSARTGAPMVLLHLLQWLKANTDIQFQLLLQDDGALRADFEAFCPVHIFDYWQVPERNLLTRIGHRILYQLNLRPGFREIYLTSLKQTLASANFDLLYVNSVHSAELTHWLTDLGLPTLLHVHELEYGMRTFGLESFRRIQPHVTRYIAVSQAVKQNLMAAHAIPAEQIDLVYAFIPARALAGSPHQPLATSIRQQLNIPQSAVLVCGSGTLDWRKGSDLFVQLAGAVNRNHGAEPIYFIWVGGNPTSDFYQELAYDVQKLGLDQIVQFIGETAQRLDYYAAADIFVLMSREDPFPLVCLENAAFGKPLLCFEQSGGIPELIEDDAGFVIPYLDVETMASKMTQLAANPELRQKLGQRAQQKVLERHDVEVAALQVLNVIIDMSSKGDVNNELPRLHRK